MKHKVFFLGLLSFGAINVHALTCKNEKIDNISVNNTAELLPVNKSFSGAACVLTKNTNNQPYILYRGDSRQASEIFDSGFKLLPESKQALEQIKTQAAWQDMLGVTSGGFTINGISTALTYNTASAYVKKEKNHDCVYSIDTKGLHMIAISPTVNGYKKTSLNFGDEVLSISAIPATSIISCTHTQTNTVEYNPNYKKQFLNHSSVLPW